MNAQEAREIVEKANFSDWCHDDPNVLFEWHQAKGYLAALEGEETKADRARYKSLEASAAKLVEALETAEFESGTIQIIVAGFLDQAPRYRQIHEATVHVAKVVKECLSAFKERSDNKASVGSGEGK